MSGEYGGKRWGKATELLIKLKESKSIKDDIFFIDQIFDLQHNTGFILNKGPFITLENHSVNIKDSTWKRPLDIRFKYSPYDMLKWCSFEVRHLYITNLNYLPHVKR